MGKLVILVFLGWFATVGTGHALDLSGNWVGRLVAEQGRCPDQNDSILSITPDAVSFAPGGGALVLQGKPSEHMSRLHAQLILNDAKQHPLPMVFEGHPEGAGRIVGVYGTPACRAHIELRRGDAG
ncbi:MAG: hypothetical protein LKH33_07930 [Acetobacter sp.]|jgi:autotransporter translocation and assembly factor TamB|nr:hypothetical protein [Acetobacter sp.]MCH4061793.1 hypothetical protein [Acetobacter sp.]MCH4089358.1 hypothetical protein [Acetobacter sp.]MCI1294164.1 hypothetical protein [Acetobacter sp.]MCI1320749.1 hypothetical protein [Acetobacter sp.]